MGFMDNMDISASGLTAQRMRMDVISQNIANASTTRTASGEPYRRRVTVLEQKQSAPFSSYLSAAGSGVAVTQITEDMSDFLLEYDPEHPDADENGYVRLPNVD